MSTLALRRLILSELAAYGAGLSPAGLLELVRLKFSGAALADVNEALGWLRDHDLAAFVPNPLDPDDRALRQWTITQRGELFLKK